MVYKGHVLEKRDKISVGNATFYLGGAVRERGLGQGLTDSGRPIFRTTAHSE